MTRQRKRNASVHWTDEGEPRIKRRKLDLDEHKQELFGPGMCDYGDAGSSSSSSSSSSSRPTNSGSGAITEALDTLKQQMSQVMQAQQSMLNALSSGAASKDELDSATIARQSQRMEMTER